MTANNGAVILQHDLNGFALSRHKSFLRRAFYYKFSILNY